MYFHHLYVDHPIDLNARILKSLLLCLILITYLSLLEIITLNLLDDYIDYISESSRNNHPEYIR